MTMSAGHWPTSPLDAADAAFAVLTCEPAPLTLERDRLGPDTGLPDGLTALPAVRDWLLAHPRAYIARDAVWRQLIRRARLDGPAWVIAAVGMAMPALRRYAGQLAAGYSGDAVDLDAEILTGFLSALRDRVDADRDAPYAALCRAAWRAGHTLRRQAAEYTPVDNIDHVTGPRTPTVPYGHPDLLVHRAVTLGLLNPEDEQPYIDIRLGRRAIEPIAARLGITVDALRMRLGRIDTRIADALADGLLTGVASPEATSQHAAQARHRAATRHAARRRAAPPVAAAV
jgi:DNA-directed RNA polymerase specialized sigma24 family protein